MSVASAVIFISMAVTLQNIADRVGVSAPTVSQILSPTSVRAQLFSEDTRKRVRKAAQDLGYRANAAARSTATGRFGAVTLLLSQHGNRSQLPARLLDGIDEALAAADLHLMVARLPDDKLTDPGEMPKLLRQLTSDGLLINYNAHIPQRMIDLIDKYRLPSVWINSKQSQNCVYPNDELAGYDATRSMIDAGHQRVAFADYTYGPSPERCHYSSPDRRAGYRRAMAEAGLQPRLICSEGNIPQDQRPAFTRSWLDVADKPTAVVCYTKHECDPIHFTASQMGISIPRELCLIATHDEPIRYFDLKIPTAVLPENRIGHEAVTMLIRQIQNSRESAQSIPVPLSMTHIDCVAPPVAD